METIEYDKEWGRSRVRALRRGVGGIYGLVDPREPERVRYVGSSKCIPYRLFEHTHYKEYGRQQTPKGLWLKGLREAGVKPVAVVLERCRVGPRQSEVRMELERWWIATSDADLNVALNTQKVACTTAPPLHHGADGARCSFPKVHRTAPSVYKTVQWCTEAGAK